VRTKSGLPKRKALRRMPVFEHGLRSNPVAAAYRHPNTQDEQVEGGYSVMSMFCGAGGLDLGFLGGFSYLGQIYPRLPFNILSAIDNDAKSIQTYNLNISAHGRVGDLTEITPDQLPKARVLIGGFPCQDFSSSGPKVGFAGERGQLYQSLVQYMRHHQPEMVVGENVPHLATLHGGQYLKTIVADFEAEGYNFAVWNLFAPDFGLSQSRRRLFIVGVRKDVGYPPMSPAPTHKNRHRPIEDALADLEAVVDESVANQSQYFVATKATAGGGQGDHTNKRGHLAYCIRANAKARIQFHYALERRLTVRECARLQSFPDEFVFPFAAMTAMTQIGNAVPPMLAHHVGSAVASHLKTIDAGHVSPPCQIGTVDEPRLSRPRGSPDLTRPQMDLFSAARR
jgi:DNA (cytosine-5)-methyltransferase 1